MTSARAARVAAVLVAGIVAAALALLLAVLAILAGTGGASLAFTRSGTQGGAEAAQSALALRDVPAGYMNLYVRAARAFALDWSVIAAIGKVECDHGRTPDPSCTRPGAVNQAGAGGPMQFLASTWTRYGRDANGDGSASRWDPADAIYAAAAYLRASGAPRDYARAIFAYNHASSYLEEVQAWAARYRGNPLAIARRPSSAALADGGLAHVVLVEGERAGLAPGAAHAALVPADAPPVVQAMVVAGNELQDLPYGPAGHPDPRGATQADCSSTVNYVLWRSGVRPISEILRKNPLAQDYERWGAAGSGRWVGIYASATHVFIVIAGLRLDTSHDGTDVGPNRAEGGPRWRIFDRIPTWARWSVRHPPGL